ncbi:alpha/beta fold hydrolase [Kutzneria buriramensis]|uniref:alpha/beta fold hydrolase n=1 Tax=Kutzneria buriramensis TaxID=1045776 RepID=UPI001476BB62|nr:alpha/beta hydrolase [Kutzneria buriramensis]
MNSSPKNILLVHGAWHGAWCWDELTPHLERHGWRVFTVDLPSTWSDPEVGMYDDAEVVGEALGAIDGPVTVLGHSYGGVPMSEAAETAPNVERLIYLAAQMLEVGEALVTPLGGPWFPADWRMVPVPDQITDAAYFDVPTELAAATTARLRPQSARAFTDAQTRASWQKLPSALIACDDDRNIPEVFIKRAIDDEMPTLVRRLPGGHSPFLARPAELADVIDEVAAAL